MGGAVARAAVDTARYVARHSQVIIQVGLAVAAVALTIINVAQLGLDPATDAAEVADVGALAADAGAEGAATADGTAADAGASAAERAGARAAESCGLSFTAGTKVLLASGKAVPISSLVPGEKVLATSTRTGRTRAEAIAAVLVHHDTNLYDLRIRAGDRAAVIDTTSNHPFWDATTRRWVKAAALKYGTHLRTPTGGTATVGVTVSLGVTRGAVSLALAFALAACAAPHSAGNARPSTTGSAAFTVRARQVVAHGRCHRPRGPGVPGWSC